MDRELMRELAREITGLPVPARQDEEEFSAALHRVEVFVGDHGRIPDAHASDAYEARLGSWLEAERVADEHAALPRKRRERIEQAVGREWRATG